ncbi:DEAD/DEAH box helicase [Aureivirga sp. CE67]|uniref:DEAD/DEAH box helicase n=1 Tax=Aureivirga sp. CE67 TaxID=1788983 RepID=UPI0018CAD79B|nr:DEAD/DEAH box helicase [Aureivirga sp. CE67]
MSTFSNLGLKQEIVEALNEMGYENPTPIQEESIPQILSSGKDLKAFAQTGTGKTAAFSLPIIQQVDVESKQVQAIILSPTRELGIQIADNIKQFTKYVKGIRTVAVYGGAKIDEQIRALKRGAHIVVGTPGRTLDLIKRGVLKLDSTRFLVLDEADEMLNMGFKEELDAILEATPDTKQTLLFSATFPREVNQIAKNYMTDPVSIETAKVNTGSDNVSHEYYLVNERNRYNALKRIADINPDIYSIVFCRTRKETKDIADQLIEDGYNADSLHGDLSQAQRDTVMQKFRKKSLQILVATDVAARGLDVNSLTHVINYKLPDQIEAYTHRSGRTGRAGNKGISIALISPKERGKLRPIERKISKKFIQNEIPNGKEVCEVQLFNVIDKLTNVNVNETEIEPYLESIYEKLEGLSREEIIQKIVSLEFNSFLEYYQNAPDLNKVSADRTSDSRGKRRNDENMTRYFINLGRKDNLNPAKLIGLINDQRITKNIEIGQIEILDTFSFFELDKNYQDQTLSSFEDTSFNGRTVNVEITKKQKGGGRGNRSGGRRRGDRDRSRGGDRDRSSKPRFNDRDRKSSSNGERSFKGGRKRPNRTGNRHQ